MNQKKLQLNETLFNNEETSDINLTPQNLTEVEALRRQRKVSKERRDRKNPIEPTNGSCGCNMITIPKFEDEIDQLKKTA